MGARVPWGLGGGGGNTKVTQVHGDHAERKKRFFKWAGQHSTASSANVEAWTGIGEERLRESLGWGWSPKGKSAGVWGSQTMVGPEKTNIDVKEGGVSRRKQNVQHLEVLL